MNGTTVERDGVQTAGPDQPNLLRLNVVIKVDPDQLAGKTDEEIRRDLGIQLKCALNALETEHAKTVQDWAVERARSRSLPFADGHEAGAEK